MRYPGGKSMIGREITNVLKAIKDHYSKKGKTFRGYIEPFCGSLGTFKHMTSEFDNCYAYDANKDIIMLWQSVKEKSFKRPNMTMALYKRLKESNEPSALRAYAGFQCSFGGIWFGSLVNEDEKVRYNRVIKDTPLIQNATFSCRDYRSLESKVISGNYFIYCDPPYKNTDCSYGPNKRSDKKTEFNSEEFWATMKRWKSYGNIVVVSEFTAPKEWRCVWSKVRSKNTNNSKTQSSKNEFYTEKLYMLL